MWLHNETIKRVLEKVGLVIVLRLSHGGNGGKVKQGPLSAQSEYVISLDSLMVNQSHAPARTHTHTHTQFSNKGIVYLQCIWIHSSSIKAMHTHNSPTRVLFIFNAFGRHMRETLRVSETDNCIVLKNPPNVNVNVNVKS
mgnify:CR=1 FL=1